MPSTSYDAGRALILVDDLFFSAKIRETAGQTGVTADCVSDPDALRHRLRQHKPALIIVDLGLRKTDATALIEQVKQDPETRDIPVIAYASHVDHDSMARAAEAGCDQVLPRSAFSRRLPELLRSAME